MVAAVVCWGDNAFEQAGVVGDPMPQGVSVVDGIGEAVQLTAGDYHTCARLDDGSAWCWGRNNRGQLGRPSGPPEGTPAAVPGVPSAASVVAGDDHTCVLTDDGAVYCFGWNTLGQVDGVPGLDVDEAVVVDLGGTAAIGLAAGREHTCAVTDTNPPTILCWGDNTFGQLGIGSTVAVDGIAQANFDCSLAFVVRRPTDRGFAPDHVLFARRGPNASSSRWARVVR